MFLAVFMTEYCMRILMSWIISKHYYVLNVLTFGFSEDLLFLSQKFHDDHNNNAIISFIIFLISLISFYLGDKIKYSTNFSKNKRTIIKTVFYRIKSQIPRLLSNIQSKNEKVLKWLKLNWNFPWLLYNKSHLR